MRLFSILLIVLSQALVLTAQEISTTTISGAAHCLVNGDHEWLESGSYQRNAIIVSGVIDKTSYPHQTHLILVVHTENRSGQAFDVQMARTANKRLYMIQNNADFKMVGSHVTFASPPLGGEWTQEHLAKSIAKAMKSPFHTLSKSSLTNAPSDLECSSYVSAKQ